ncbi:hypothetical protein BCR42DRAFT_407531 [Absidia repens]|uniref:LIM domain-domain-containing protein n=1 Tax=Absidia repens TaxID=90262 RepID=A0A1X2ISE3_9FUNG|nr:hypothetical protein BCR42DRAFT_407531 [Absidia repens]
MNGLDLNKSGDDSSFSAATPSSRLKDDDTYSGSDISTNTPRPTENSAAVTTGKHELEHSSCGDTYEPYSASTDPSANTKDMDETYKTPVSSAQQQQPQHHQPKTDAMPPIPTFSFGNVNTSNEDTMPPIPTFSFGNNDDDNHRQQDSSNDDILNLSLGLRCGGCDKLISGMAITAAGHRWHADCFKCQHCHQDLEHVAFYEKDGLPYCALDYHELFTTRCQYCHTPIEEKSIHALGKYYHVGHFFCRECGKPFDEDSTFMEHDGHPYCEKDYLAKFAHKCKGCKEDITGDFLEALNGKWHMTCFVCVDCGRAFASNTFYVRNNLPYCEQHSRRIKKPK